jgi:hypothetical protein
VDALRRNCVTPTTRQAVGKGFNVIRFVHIGDQINEDQNDFAFFDTITNSFIDFNGGQVFDSKDHFDLFAKDDPRYERCIGLMPTASNNGFNLT